MDFQVPPLAPGNLREPFHGFPLHGRSAQLGDGSSYRKGAQPAARREHGLRPEGHLNLRSHKDFFMVLCMKTTVDVPDDLLIQAKKRAAELRQPLRALIADGLRLRLAQVKEGRRKPRKLHFVTVAGGLPPGLDLTDRAKMHDWLKREP